jgi:cystathionine beta-lyase/cystathionine gamma-synthase
MSPLTAWHILVYGLSTLAVRIPKQQENAMRIASFLEQNHLVERVEYPGLESFQQHDLAKRLLRDYEGNFAPGIIVYFTLKGKNADESKHRGELMMDYVAEHSYTITLAVSLGQVRTLIEHPGSMTHASYQGEDMIKAGIDPGGIRLAVGIENPDDVIKDLTAALAHIDAKASVLV